MTSVGRRCYAAVYSVGDPSPTKFPHGQPETALVSFPQSVAIALT
jgi:hypothetical protein